MRSGGTPTRNRLCDEGTALESRTQHDDPPPKASTRRRAPAPREFDPAPSPPPTPGQDERKLRPFLGRLDRADPGCRPEDVGEILAEIEAINERLQRCGLTRRVPLPRGTDTDRDRISTQLLLTLKDLREHGVQAEVGTAGSVRTTQGRTGWSDQRIVDLLYRLSVPVLLMFCRSRIRRSEFVFDAQDLLEDVFLSIWLKCDRFQDSPSASYTGWALVIAENHILQLTRRLRRERERVRVVAETSPRLCATLDPARDAAAHEVIGRVRTEYMLLILLCAEALVHLPPRMLEVLNLRDRDGMSYDAIAAQLAASRSHVGMWIRRARKRVFETVSRALRRIPSPEKGRTP